MTNNANLRFATLSWTGRDLIFEGGARDGPGITIDPDGASGPTPVITLLLAVGSCSGSDVVSILQKMRVRLTECRVDIEAERRAEDPRRVVRLGLAFRLRGEGLDEAKARRAVDLSVGKYCSVIHSLAPDISIAYQLDLG